MKTCLCYADDMAKFFVTGALILFLIFVTYQIVLFQAARGEARVEYEKASDEMSRFLEDKERLERDAQYYGNLLNLEKELRARFNYKVSGEHTLILVPNATSVQN